MDNVKPIKKLGQNFLKDKFVLRRIVDSAGIDYNDVVLEIGTGTGNLTKYLCEKSKFVYTVEKDARLCSVAKENLKEFDNVKIINNDILEIDVGAGPCARPLQGNHRGLPLQLKVVGNLPYYITTPIIFKLFDYRQYISDIVIMVQKEVAQRIIALPGGKDYGILSCTVQFYAKPQILFYIKKGLFYPQPEVDSALVRLEVLKQPSVSVTSEEKFLKLIKTAFNQRRKTLVNSLCSKSGLGLIKNEALDILQKSGIDPARRAETLSLEEFARICNFYCR